MLSKYQRGVSSFLISKERSNAPELKEVRSITLPSERIWLLYRYLSERPLEKDLGILLNSVFGNFMLTLASVGVNLVWEPLT